MPRASDAWLEVAAARTAEDNLFLIEQAAKNLEQETASPAPRIVTPRPAKPMLPPLKMPQTIPARKTPSLSARMAQHVPTSINIASWIFNGTIAAGIFAAMSAHDVTACDLLPEPARTNVCGTAPR